MQEAHTAATLLVAAPVLAFVLGACAPAGDARAPAAAGDAARGARLVAQYQCGSCHAIPGVAAARGRVGPSLESYGLRSYIAGRFPNRQDLLAQWIERPSSLVPGTPMPDMGVPPADARDMAAWLMELR